MRTIAEVRRLRLLELKDKWRTWPAMNEKLGYTARDSTLSQYANQSLNSRSDKPKEMGSDLARKIEQVFDKPEGWMDTDPDQFWPFSVITVGRWRLLDVAAMQADQEKRRAEQNGATYTQLLNGCAALTGQTVSILEQRPVSGVARVNAQVKGTPAPLWVLGASVSD